MNPETEAAHMNRIRMESGEMNVINTLIFVPWMPLEHCLVEIPVIWFYADSFIGAN